MAKRDVNGLHGPVFVKKPNGREYGPYWFAWRGRGAPRVHGEYGTPDFWASYDAAVRDRHVPEPGKFKSLVTLYKGSKAYQDLRPSTKKYVGRWLDRITDDFGALSIAAFDNPRARKNIVQWRNQFAATPRKADMGLQVLSVV
jgi:hypothetical protein